MTKEKVITTINQIFEEAFEVDKDKIVPEANLFLDLGLDSLDIVDLVAALQSKFDIQIRDDEKIREIRTLQDIYDYVWKVKEELESKS